MKRTVWLAIILIPALATDLIAANGTAAQTRPDGSTVTENFTTAGASNAWFAAPLTAGHSYVAEVEAPFNGAGSLSDGSVASTTPVALNANGATQVSISGAMAGGAFFGSAAVFHNGAKSAITGGIYQVQPGTASGANFLWSFTEIRSSGSTSGQ